MQAIEELNKAAEHLVEARNAVFVRGEMTARTVAAQFFLHDAVDNTQRALELLKQEKEET